MRDNGELLPHVLMAELLRLVGELVGSAQRGASAELQEILELLETEIAGSNSETQNVIAVSFLEHLEAEPFFSGLYALLGSRLREAHAPFAWQSPPSQNARQHKR